MKRELVSVCEGSMQKEGRRVDEKRVGKCM